MRVIFQAFEMLSDDSLVDECDPVMEALSIYGGSNGWWTRIGGWGVIGLLGIVIWAG